MEIQETLATVESAWMALQALQVYQDHKAGRVPGEMFTVPGLVHLENLGNMGLWGGGDSQAFLESQGYQVSVMYIVNANKQHNGLCLTLGCLILSVSQKEKNNDKMSNIF